MVISFSEDEPEAVNRLVAAIDGRDAADRGWTFVMIGPEQNASVVRWLRANSDRPLVALTLWSELFTALRSDTGEILLTREELAERVETSIANVSRVMTQLEEAGAISKRREGRGVRYFMNPRVGTHLAGARRAQAQAAAPKVVAMARTA